ncbi:HAD family hydrolase [Shewanella sp. GXUN23E]|uniref:HAD family hydrolase n=1 Tax=Shewanella sp. GXUN23E TaxID=3422498 RepID=UPI003D7D0326
MSRDSRYQLVIFDWDGTLMNSVPKIVACVQAMATEYQLPVPAETAIRQVIGYSLDEALYRLFGDAIQGAALTAGYRRHYLQLDASPSPLFDGVEQLLDTINNRGIKMAVATGKGRDGLDRLLTQTRLTSLFAASRCADETASKPDPLMLKQILAELDVPVSSALMVGDALMDLHMANHLGMDAIGVSYGAFTVPQLRSASPKAIIDRPLDLLQFL